MHVWCDYDIYIYRERERQYPRHTQVPCFKKLLPRPIPVPVPKFPSNLTFRTLFCILIVEDNLHWDDDLWTAQGWFKVIPGLSSCILRAVKGNVVVQYEEKTSCPEV